MPPKLTLQSFISKATHVHGDKYDYSAMVYIHSQSKVIIVCRDHGPFEQIANSHLMGCGCPRCGNVCSHSNEEWIQKATTIHSGKYDYSLTRYTTKRNKVRIICPDHGEFEQIANNHLNGKGCPYCTSSKGETKIRSWLTTHNVLFEEQKRFTDCRSQFPLPFDFYLPMHAMCIEFDGIQHFEPTSFGSDKSIETKLKNFAVVTHHDSIKTSFCIKNHLRLVRIPHYNFEYIDDILTNLNLD